MKGGGNMNYDGPSYYKKNEQKSILHKEEKINGQVASKYNTVFKRNRRTEIEREAETHLTPPPSKLARKTIESPKRVERNEHFFRSKKIPASLQNLNGWKKTKWNQNLLAELEKRLLKEEEEYLLFAPEIDKKKKKEVKNKSIPSSNEEKNMKSQEKISKVQTKMKKDLNKPATGLHRSLSKIIAEDQAALKNGKNNLDSLFI